MKINLKITFSNIYDEINFYKEFKRQIPKFYYDKYGFIQLDSLDFNFNKSLYKKMIELKIIECCDLIIDNDKYETYDIRFLRDIDDFKTTSCKCILIKITY